MSSKQVQSSSETYFSPEVFARISELYFLSLPDLLFESHSVHRDNNNPNAVQFCTLSSIKTGLCPEDCHYCPQSVYHDTGLKAHKLLDIQDIIKQALDAKDNGSTRFCMGAAWRNLPEGNDFNTIIELIKAVNALDMEVCCTLGMISEEQAFKLKDAGLHTYNHNIDTSAEFYEEIISTRKFEDRINTIKNISKAGIRVCSGGIIGMGESVEDRLKFLSILASMSPQPDSVPINTLVPVEGTPLEDRPIVDPLELVKVIAIARIIMPKSKVRLSAGRKFLSEEAQALCFFAGANSIHTGDKLLTTENMGINKDKSLIQKLGMTIEQI